MNDRELLCLLRIKGWPSVPDACSGGERAWQAYVENAYAVDKERLGKFLLGEPVNGASTSDDQVDFGFRISPWAFWGGDAIRTQDTTPHRDDVGVFGLAPVAYGNAQQTRINDPDDFPEPVLYSFGVGVIDSLLNYPRVAPLPAQQRMWDDVIADVQRVGVTLPPHDPIFVESVHRRVQAGQAARYDYEDGRVRFEVVLDASRFPAELRETMYHECAHLHDYYVNPGRFDRVELERRAVRFASRMVGRGPF